jgi:predicted MFS family arabinose efflux permease
VLIRGFAFGFGVAGYQALVPAAVRDQLHGSEIHFGLMLGLFGIGSILAALFIRGARRRFGVEAVLAAATLSFVLAQSVLAEATSVYQALPAAFVAGGGWVMALTSLNVSMQMRSPENIIGRCLSIYQAVTFGGMALGSWAWGAAADWSGLPAALHGASAFLVVSIVVLRLLAPMPKPHEGRLGNAPPLPARR